jgi:5'-methylthioadenosine phosphorylase
VGSLRRDLHPGQFVVVDQLVDRTWGRPDTYLDGPAVEHVSFADPYCPELRRVLINADPSAHTDGTVVVISGPRFATRAESVTYRRAGYDVINMTQYPEAYLARELGMCYGGLALVTDYDTGVEADPGVEAVTMAAILEVLSANVVRVRDVLVAAIGRVPAAPGCTCRNEGAPSLRRAFAG